MGVLSSLGKVFQPFASLKKYSQLSASLKVPCLCHFASSNTCMEQWLVNE